MEQLSPALSPKSGTAGARQPFSSLKESGKDPEEQIVGPLTFASKEAAQQWLQQVGKDHGFASVHIVLRFISEAEKEAAAAAFQLN